MSANNSLPRSRSASYARQQGVAAVEVAILAIVFFIAVFCMTELARAVYVIHTAYDATRYAANAAALVSHSDNTELNRIRQRAVFRHSPGPLLLGKPVTDNSIRIDYMALLRNSDGSLSLQPISPGNLPVCPRRNREICMANPHAANCIRFVRARLCHEAGSAECNHALFEPLLPFVPLSFNLPHATSLRMTESFGSMPENTPCL